MTTLIRSVLAGQYGAALAMLRACLDKADAATWLATSARYPFWQVAYHTLFITDLYLAPEEKAFRPPPFHREGYSDLGPVPWAPDRQIVIDQPYDKETLVAYLDSIRAKAKAVMGAETDAVLAGPSGFSWLPFTRLELHAYSTRHVQHHTGQLAAVLRRQQGHGVSWVGSAPL